MGFFSRSTPAPATPKEDEKPKGPATKELLTSPLPSSLPTKVHQYDEAQLKQIAELKEYAYTLLLPADDEYYPWEKRFIDDCGTCPRYMRAAKWKMDDAKKRIKGTIEWRRDFRPELIEPGSLASAAKMGKLLLTGFDRDGRPIIIMRPGRGGPPDNDMQTRLLVFLLERAIDLMPDGQEQVAIIVDYRNAGKQANVPINVSLNVLHILQNHYVERLGRGIVMFMPWFVNAFFSAISPFLDPITRDKIRFSPTLTDLVEPAMLDADYPGGEYNFEFDFDSYWQQLMTFCCISPDGKRVDAQGKPWVPPSGRGIKYAVEHRGDAAEKENAVVEEKPEARQEAAIDEKPVVPAVAQKAEDTEGPDEKTAIVAPDAEGDAKPAPTTAAVDGITNSVASATVDEKTYTAEDKLPAPVPATSV